MNNKLSPLGMPKVPDTKQEFYYWLCENVSIKAGNLWLKGHWPQMIAHIREDDDMTAFDSKQLRQHNAYDSALTKVLLEEHPEWSMEVVREAALICSNAMIIAQQQAMTTEKKGEAPMTLEDILEEVKNGGMSVHVAAQSIRELEQL